jgi:hypothetical protein
MLVIQAPSTLVAAAAVEVTIQFMQRAEPAAQAS